MRQYYWKQVIDERGLGISYPVKVPLMPRLKDDWLDVTLYIYPSTDYADRGMKSGASGFLVGVPSEENEGFTHTYAVTNQHVIEEFEEALAEEVVLRLNTNSGIAKSAPTNIKAWIPHRAGDDLAICPIWLTGDWKVSHLGIEKILSKERAENLSIGPGDETSMLGRYKKHDGTFTNLPVARWGNIAMNPLEPIIQESRNDFRQDSYLVESHSINGFSGSPVFVTVPADNRDAKEKLTVQDTFLLGIDWGHFHDRYTFDEKKGKDGWVDIPSGMMMVVPSWKLLELLNDEEIMKIRKEVDEVVKKKRKESSVTLDSGISKEDFENTLKKVSQKITPSEPGKESK